MQIHLIWAQDQNGGIGKDGQLPWHIPEDLKNFKKLTLNSTIVMGRKTWDSLPIKPLPNRRNIVLSSKHVTNTEYYTSAQECIEKLDFSNDDLFVIGGSTVYQCFIHRADELHITIINERTKGIDIFFPITMEKIREYFHKISEKKLGEHAIYSHWVKR